MSELKENIKNLLLSLKERGYDRGKIEKELGLAENSIDQNLARGGTKKLLTSLTLLHNSILQKATSKDVTPTLKKAIDNQQNAKDVAAFPAYAGSELFKAIITLTESNKGLVGSNQAIVNTNQTIADTNAILAKKLVKEEVTDNSPSSIPIIDTSIWMDLREVLAEIATGSGVYKSMDEARREIGMRLKLHVGGKQNSAGTQTDGGKKSIA